MATEPARHLAGLEHVGLRQLKNELSGVLDRTVRKGRSIVVTNHNRPDAILIPPEDYDTLLGERARRQELSGTVAMLLAAVSAGVQVPSETLDELGLGAAELDWRALNAFQARYPVVITHGEDGEPLPSAGVHPSHLPVAEDDEELQLG